MKWSITLKELLVVLLLILVLFSIYTFPLVLHMGEVVYGVGDAGITYWNMYNFKHSLFHDEGVPFLESDLIFQPEGISLLSHTNTMALNLYALCFDNHILAMNTYALWHLLLGGAGMYLFTKYMTGDRFAALFSTVLYCFCSYSTCRFVEHINLISTGFIPFYLLSFFKAFSFQEGKLFPRLVSRKFLSAFIILLIINFFMDQVVGASLVLATMAVVAGQALLFVYHHTRKKYFWTGFVVFMAIGHFIIQLIKKGLPWDDGGAFYFGSDLAWFFIPVGKWLMRFDVFEYLAQEAVFVGRLEASVFVGFSTLVVLGICVWQYVRKQHKNHCINLMIATTGIMLLMMHPEVRIMHNKLFYSITALLHYIPLVNNYRVPSRIIIVLVPFLPVLCGLVLRQSSSVPLKKMIWPIAIVVLMVELCPAGYQQYNEGPEPDYYSFLSRQEGETALIIPFGRRDGKRVFGEQDDTHQFFYQEVYQKKLIGGYLSRVPDAYFESVAQDTLLQRLTKLQKGEEDVPACTLEETKTFMQAYHPDWIVVTPPYATDEMVNYIRRSFGAFIKKEHQVDGAYLFAVESM